MASGAGRIDVHCHSMTPAYREAISRLGPTIRTPEWTPGAAVEFLDRHGIAAAVLSLSVPGTHLGDDAKARVLARRCNEEAAEFIQRYPSRLGAFATLPIPDVQGACAEACHSLDVLKLDGIGLLASYHGTYLGDPSFDPVWSKYWSGTSPATHAISRWFRHRSGRPAARRRENRAPPVFPAVSIF